MISKKEAEKTKETFKRMSRRFSPDPQTQNKNIDTAFDVLKDMGFFDAEMDGDEPEEVRKKERKRK